MPKREALPRTKRYPVLYRCDHCGNDELLARLIVNDTCPVCKFGRPQRRHWNGMAYC